MTESIEGARVLRSHPFFERVSARHLTDMLELVGHSKLEDSESQVIEKATHLVVIDGRIGFEAERGELKASLAAGEVWESPFQRAVTVKVTGDSLEPARFFALTTDDRVFPPFVPNPPAAPAPGPGMPTVDIPPMSPGLPRPRHLVWVTERQGFGAPVEAFAQLFATAVAEQFPAESVGIVWLRNGNIERLFWDGKDFRRLRDPNPGDPVANDPILDASHLFVANVFEPQVLPPLFLGVPFHQIVYLTDRIPQRMPEDMGEILIEHSRPRPDSAGGETHPYFNSFIVTLLLGNAERAPRPLRARPALGAPPSRIERDHRSLRLDKDDIQRHWEYYHEVAQQWDPSFGVALRESRRDVRESTDRLGRAVTSRQVGIAISGGGATSYRMIPMFHEVARLGVPIDIVSGVSGGALLGAYYCDGGLEGLTRAVDNGLIFQLATFAAPITTEAIRRYVDWDLGQSRVGDLEVRLVALTTALRRNQPPEAEVVEDGSLGEAVQKSGSAPGLFAPTTKQGVRYVDGGASTMLPARVLQQYGADLVFACNTIPGPKRRNPFGGTRLGSFLYRHTPVGRFIDLWVSGAYMTEQASREAGRDADEFFTPTPAERPLLEAFLFLRAKSIVGDSTADLEVKKAARRFADVWEEFIDR